MTRSELLHAAEVCVCGQREEDYGTPEDSFRVIGELWETYIKEKCVGDPAAEVCIVPEDVAALLALLKIARIATGHGKSDNWVDLAGYAACGGYLQKLAAQQAVRDEKTRRFTLQQCKDMMLITMHEDFGWGEERPKKLSDCYDQTFMTYAEMCLADAKTDKQIWFTQGKVDERLKKACGKYFVPWDERYR